MGLLEDLAALAAPRPVVRCHACRLLDQYDGDEKQALEAALGSRAAAKRVSEVVRAHGERLPEADVRDHRAGRCR